MQDTEEDMSLSQFLVLDLEWDEEEEPTKPHEYTELELAASIC